MLLAQDLLLLCSSFFKLCNKLFPGDEFGLSKKGFIYDAIHNTVHSQRQLPSHLSPHPACVILFFFFYYVPNTQFGAYLNSSSIDRPRQPAAISYAHQMRKLPHSLRLLSESVWIWGYIHTIRLGHWLDLLSAYLS